MLLEIVEGNLRADSYHRITANVKGSSPEALSAEILSRPELAGLQGPTISKVYKIEEQDWYSVSLVVPREGLLDAVDHLRQAGGVDISASRVSYLFKDQCRAYANLLESLEEN